LGLALRAAADKGAGLAQKVGLRTTRPQRLARELLRAMSSLRASGGGRSLVKWKASAFHPHERASLPER
jgi:hypothetical protein